MPKVIGIIVVVLCVVGAITTLWLQNRALKSELALEKRITAELSANLSQSVANVELAKAEATKLTKLCQDEIDASKELNLIVKRAVVKAKPEAKLNDKPKLIIDKRVNDPPIVFAGVNNGIISNEISKDIINYINNHFN